MSLKVFNKSCQNCLLSKDRIVSPERAKEIIEECKKKQMYSEEDLFNFAIFCSNNHSLDDSDKDNICWQPIFKDNIKLTMKEMFEQFKKQQQRLPFFTNQNKMELNWENAKVWQEKANEKKEIFDEPKWSWDCNFKLDFDGSLLRISSRFYPPHKNAGDWWEGAVLVNFLGEEILRKEFKCNTLEELKTEVEKFTKHYAGAIKARLS